MKEKYHELDAIARKLTISYIIYLVSLIIYPVSQVLVIGSGISLVVRGLHLWYLISYLALCLYVYKGQNVLSQKGASKRSGKAILTVSLVALILSEFPLGFQVFRMISPFMILLMGMKTVCWYVPPVIGIFAPLIVMSDFKKLKKKSGDVAGSFAMNETGYLECVGKAVASFLSTSVFLGFILMMFIADSYSDDSRAGFVFPVIIPLLLIGVIYGIRAWSDLRTLHKNTPHHLPRSAVFVVGGLLIPFFVGILLAARFLLLFIWPFISSLQSPQHLQQSTVADSLNQGFRWYQKGNYDQAIKEYTAAIKMNPHSPDAFYGRGLSWYQKGNYDQAINDYTEVIKIDPHYPDVFFYRGAVWERKGAYDQAIKDYTAAIAINPRAYTYNNLSWLLATCPIAQYRNGAKAIELAKKAIELNPQIMYYWDTLAAAYAEIGDFNNAITTQEKVINSLKKEGLKKEGVGKKGTEEELSAYLVEAVKHLDAYKKHEPWREVRVSTE
jgi:Flp pilus assembly protein TadD